MKISKKHKKIIIILMLMVLLSSLYFITRRIYHAEAQLPYYCLYSDSEEAAFKVYVKGGTLMQNVDCKTDEAAEQYLAIAYRSKVYWGYRGPSPIKSAYGDGEDAPYMRTWHIDNYGFVKSLYMFGQDFPIKITVNNIKGEPIYCEYYDPKNRDWISGRIVENSVIIEQ